MKSLENQDRIFPPRTKTCIGELKLTATIKKSISRLRII
jgi:hypothetical protein